jgi:hypothetical protein
LFHLPLPEKIALGIFVYCTAETKDGRDLKTAWRIRSVRKNQRMSPIVLRAPASSSTVREGLGAQDFRIPLA